jgi:hypothetical protein
MTKETMTKEPTARPVAAGPPATAERDQSSLLQVNREEILSAPEVSLVC